jgi:hypothetical protein
LDPIFPSYPGDSDPSSLGLLDAEVSTRVAIFLPLLKTLKQVRFGLMMRSNEHPQALSQIMLQEGCERRRFKDEALKEHAPLNLSGGVEIVNSTGFRCTQKFAGLEWLAGDPEFADLKASPNWPKIASEYSATGHFSDKADPHSAVCFISQPAHGSGTLTVRWSVFLPLSEMREEIPCKGRFDYTLLLHGYYFVDAGRALIDFGSRELASRIEAGPSIRHMWNNMLKRRGMLPLLLPALHSFKEKASLHYEDVYILTRSIMGSAVFRDGRDHICRDYQWVYRIIGQDGEWCLINAESPGQLRECHLRVLLLGVADDEVLSGIRND